MTTPPLHRVGILELGTQLRLHRLAWSRVRTIRGWQRLRQTLVLCFGPVLTALLVALALLSGGVAIMLPRSPGPMAGIVAGTALAAACSLAAAIGALSAAAGGVPASPALLLAQRGQVWTIAAQDAVLTVQVTARRRRTLGNNHYARGHGDRLRLRLTQQLLAAGKVVRFKATSEPIKALYRRELAAHTAELEQAGVTITEPREGTWELHPPQ